MDPFPVGDEHSHPANLLADIRWCSQVGTRVFFLEGGRTRTGTVQNTETIEVRARLHIYVLMLRAYMNDRSGSSLCRYKAGRRKPAPREAAVRIALLIVLREAHYV